MKVKQFKMSQQPIVKILKKLFPQLQHFNPELMDRSNAVGSLCLTDYSLNSSDLSGFSSPAGPSLGSMAAWQQHQLGSLG